MTNGNCRSTVIPPLINPVTNDIVVNESDKANVLNNYFCSISSTANNIDRSTVYLRKKICQEVVRVVFWKVVRVVSKWSELSYSDIQNL
jgi:hypothetical protein